MFKACWLTCFTKRSLAYANTLVWQRRNHLRALRRFFRHTEEELPNAQNESVQSTDQHRRSDAPSHSPYEEEIKFPEYKEAPKFRGRRFLLLMSFAAGVITLFLTAMMFYIKVDPKSPDSGPRSGLIIFFTMLFTAFYSPVSILHFRQSDERNELIREHQGAGAIPFLYSVKRALATTLSTKSLTHQQAEIFPNEGRE